MDVTDDLTIKTKSSVRDINSLPGKEIKNVPSSNYNSTFSSTNSIYSQSMLETIVTEAQLVLKWGGTGIFIFTFAFIFIFIYHI